MLLAGLALDTGTTPYTAQFVLGLFFWLSVVLLVPSMVGGIGLLRNKRWARVLLIIVSVEFLFAVPVGTALGAYGLWALLSREAESPATWTAVRPPAIHRQRTGILLAMLSVAIAFVVVLGAGFLLSRHPAPAISMNGIFGFVAAIGIALISIGVARLMGIPILTFRAGVRVPAGASVPPLPRFSENQKIGYRNKLGATVTCPHLEPFERAMRSAGIPLVPGAPSTANAKCRIYRPALQRQFAPREPVAYLEYFEAERSAEDIPVAQLICRQCRAHLYVLHPAESNLSTPWFPAAPPSPLTTVQRTLPSRGCVTAIACSPRGGLAAVAAGIYNTPQEFGIWDTARGEPVRSLPPHGVIRAIAWTNDEKVVITGRGVLWSGGRGTRGPSIFVWDAASGTELLRFGSDLFGVRGIALSPDGKMLLASGMLGETRAEGSTVDLWEVASGKMIARLARVDTPACGSMPFFTSVAFTPDGALAVAGCDRYLLPANSAGRGSSDAPVWWNRGVRAWRLSDRQELDLVRQTTPVRHLAISRDGARLFAAGTRFGVWSLINGSMLWDKANGYDNGMAASPDGQLVARGTGYQVDNHGPYVDSAIELYDAGSGELVSLAVHRAPPEAIAFHPGGNAFLAGDAEGELRFWNWNPNTLARVY